MATEINDTELDGDVMVQITIDAVNNIDPKDSKLKYNKAMLKFRKKTDDWLKTLPPGAVVQLPAL